MQGNSRAHLTFFLNKIKANEPFGIIRPGDGEYAIMRNRTISTGDNWTFKEGGRLANDLMSAICEPLPEYYVGISCPGCNGEICDYMRSVLPARERITYANIFCNRNWRYFIDFMKGREFYYIGPGTAETKEFNVLGRLAVDPQLVEKWDSDGQTFLAAADAFVAPHKGRVFCISAGPIAKILVPRLMKAYPSNIYIDCGSSIDSYLKGYTNRQYNNESQYFAQTVCNFEAPHHTREVYTPPAGTPVEPADLTAILTLYKRPHTLAKQLAAIRNQTVQPKEIMLWVNQADGVVIPPEITRDKSIHIIYSSKNTGVWGRFSGAILAQTTYVCVFDDDTIPGRRWFENCLQTMHETPGLLGTVGLIFTPDERYVCAVPRVGWPGPNSKTTQVDIVGHSWFFRREWLSALFMEMPVWPDMFVAGEDIAFSAGLQKCGIPTLVPPHPPGQEELYGSIPQDAWKYGMETHAISMQHSVNKFEKCLRYHMARGFKKLLTIMAERPQGLPPIEKPA